MSIDVITLNTLVNPTFPYTAVYPALYQKQISKQPEQVLALAHIELSNAKREGILVLSNQRILMYLLDDSFWKKKRKSLVNMGIDKLKGEIIGAIPGVSDIEALYSAVKEKYDDGIAMKGPSDEEVDVMIREEMARLSELSLLEEAVYLENPEGWEEKVNVSWAEAAEALEELHLVHDKIIFKWKSAASPNIPTGLIMRNPKVKDAFMMPVLHAILLYFKADIEKHKLYVVKDEVGTPGILQTPGDQDFEDLIAEDVLHLLRPEKALPEGYEQPWHLKRNKVKKKAQGLTTKEIALQKCNELFPHGLIYRMIEKKLFGKKFIDSLLRPQFIAAFTEIQAEVQSKIFDLLKADDILVNDIWIACDSNVIDPYKNGFFFTDKGFVYKNRSQKAILTPYADLDEDSIAHLFGSGYGPKTVDRWFRPIEKSEDGVLIGNQTFPYYLEEAYKALLEAIRKLDLGVSEDFANFKELTDRQREPFKTLAKQDWCQSVSMVFQTDIQTELLTMFLAQIEPVNDQDTNWVWWFTGKMPSTYLNAEAIRDQQTALGVYLKALETHFFGKTKSAVSSSIPILNTSTIGTEDLKEAIDFFKRHVYPQLEGNNR